MPHPWKCGCLEQPALVEGVPVHSRELEVDDFSGPFQSKPPYDSMIQLPVITVST